jgi:pimeloyl-ACP methyl ester carboxylesterase
VYKKQLRCLLQAMVLTSTCLPRLQAYPQWQVLLVDLRCHGESHWQHGRPQGQHSVDSAAADVLALLRHLKLFPNSLIGHSFGGKVVMSMVQQFGARLPRPVQVRRAWLTGAAVGGVAPAHMTIVLLLNVVVPSVPGM